MGIPLAQPARPDRITKSSSFRWTESTDDTGVAEYVIYQDGVETGTASVTSFTATGLSPDTTYDFWVIAVDLADNESDPSETVMATTDPDTVPPTAPGTPTLSSKTHNSVTIAWSLASDNIGVASYDVYRDGAVVGSTNEPDNTFADSGLDPDTPYDYYVTAKDAVPNVSAPSGTLSVTTDPTPQTLIYVSDISLERRSFGKWYAGRAVIRLSDETGSPVDGATVTVQWSGLAGDTDSGTTAGGAVQLDSDKVANSASGEFVVTVTGVSGTGYTYDPAANIVTAAWVDTSGSSCSVGPPDTDPPSAPSFLTATAGPGSVSLDWDDNSTDPDWASFSVYRSTTSGSGHALIAEGLTSSQYMDGGLTGGTTYFYLVTAKDTSGNESPSSNEASATPTDPPQLSMYVSAIGVGLLQQGKNYTGTASVTVVDQDGASVAGAQVEGFWTLSAASIGSASASTDGSGVATIDSSKQKASSGEVFEFTVTNLVLSGYTYDPASNVVGSGSAAVP